MSKLIEFGTDGWRAINGEEEGFSELNVKRVIGGIFEFVSSEYGVDKDVFIGYDPRSSADKFAKMSARMLLDLGLRRVYLSSQICPTPAVAYQAKKHNGVGIMFTASHNPSNYLGIKFIPDYGGPATDDITLKIEENIRDVININEVGNVNVQICSFKEEYFKQLTTLVNFDKIREIGSRIIFNPIYGSSIGFFDEILRSEGIDFEVINGYFDSKFGGKLPDPKPKQLKDLMLRIKQDKDLKTIGLSNDGDADRFGVVNELGEYVSANEIIALLLIHLKKNRQGEGPLIKTVGSSIMLNIVAEKLGIEVIETKVGFKWVGLGLRKYNGLIGGEESGGLSIYGHIPEKDGILANLLILEMLSYEKKPLYKLQEDLQYKFVNHKFINERIDIKFKTDIKKLKLILKDIQFEKAFNRCEIMSVSNLDGTKIYLEDGLSSVLIRPSGTEPLLRFYFESNSKSKLKNLKLKMNNFIIKNNLNRL